MNRSLTRRLLLYFSVTLLAFAVIIGGVFSFLFRRYASDLNAADLEHRAAAIAAMMNEPAAEAKPSRPEVDPTATGDDSGAVYEMRRRGQRHGRMMGRRGNHHDDTPAPAVASPAPDSAANPSPHAYCRHRITTAGRQPADGQTANGAAEGTASLAAYLRRLNDLAASEVWLVDKTTRTMTYYGDDESTSYEELPAAAEAMLDRLFAGETVTSGDFSAFLGVPSVTAGVPIKDSDGTVTGALLLHRTLEDARKSERDAVRMLALALGLAFLLAAGLSLLLARRFVRPLAQMETTAAALTEGRYETRTAIDREDEIGSLAKSLDTLAARLAEAEAERGRLAQMRQDFLAGVSHELRTPITVLKGSLELLASGLLADEAKKRDYLCQMKENIEALERLVGDLFELTRLQNADFTIEQSPMNLPDALADAIRAAQRLAAGKEVVIEGPEALPPVPIRGDYGRLRQMFLTVLDNAVKFSPDGGRIETTLSLAGQEWRVTIRDHGPGIDAGDLPHIFERFHRQHGPLNAKGTGLGLAIAREIARRHDITIECQSVAGEGAAFLFSGTAADGDVSAE